MNSILNERSDRVMALACAFACTCISFSSALELLTRHSSGPTIVLSATMEPIDA